MKKLSEAKIISVKTNELKYEEKVSNVLTATAFESSRIWMGRVIVEAGKESGAQHHSESETGCFVLQGNVRIYYGENYNEYEDLNPHDFVHIPPFVPYMLKNLSDSEDVVFITSRKPSNFIVNVSKDEIIEEGKEQKISVTRAEDLNAQTIQTENLSRQSGVNVPNFWMGRVTGAPGQDSGAHHHGGAETAGFILSGRTSVYYGEGYKEHVDLEPGDFIYVPPMVPHIERNIHSEPVVFITARNPKNVVVNL